MLNAINSYAHLLMLVTHFIINENAFFLISIAAGSGLILFLTLYVGGIILFLPKKMELKEKLLRILFDVIFLTYITISWGFLLYGLFVWASLDTSPIPSLNSSLPGLANDTLVAIIGTIFTVVSCGGIFFKQSKYVQVIFSVFMLLIFFPVVFSDLIHEATEPFMNDFLIFIGLFFSVYATIYYIWDRSKGHFKNRKKRKIKSTLTKRRYKIIMRVIK